jgi:hypothetical protein
MPLNNSQLEKNLMIEPGIEPGTSVGNGVTTESSGRTIYKVKYRMEKFTL